MASSQAVQACRTAFNTPGQRGHPRLQGLALVHGATAFGMFNTIQPPNDTFGGCRFECGHAGMAGRTTPTSPVPRSAHPGGAQLCLRATAASSSSRAPSTSRPGGPSAPGPVARSSAPTPTDPECLLSRTEPGLDRARPRAPGCRDACRSSAALGHPWRSYESIAFSISRPAAAAPWEGRRRPVYVRRTFEVTGSSPVGMRNTGRGESGPLTANRGVGGWPTTIARCRLSPACGNRRVRRSARASPLSPVT